MKFPEYYLGRQAPDEGQKAQQPKNCDNNNKDKDNSPHVNNINIDSSSSQKFKQKKLILFICYTF